MAGNIIGGYKEYIVIEREDLEILEQAANQMMSEAQNDHNVENIREAKIWLRAVEWIKAHNIYTKDFQIKG